MSLKRRIFKGFLEHSSENFFNIRQPPMSNLLASASASCSDFTRFFGFDIPTKRFCTTFKLSWLFDWALSHFLITKNWKHVWRLQVQDRDCGKIEHSTTYNEVSGALWENVRQIKDKDGRAIEKIMAILLRTNNEQWKKFLHVQLTLNSCQLSTIVTSLLVQWIIFFIHKWEKFPGVDVEAPFGNI